MKRGPSQEQKMALRCSPCRERSSELVFLDVETTIPVRKEKRFRMLEFGAIMVCPRKLVEKRSYSTLIRPGDLSMVPESSSRSDGITREAVAAAPKFEEVAATIYGILHGKVWVGHNILRFDSARIREAFAEIGHAAPKPAGMIDSLDILLNKFGPRAGNMKMASLAAYFGLGKQKHREFN
ncbi:NEN4 protein [Nymphaea thermarum]|nr:NEN4 protein [Nymphaea thermarum]